MKTIKILLMVLIPYFVMLFIYMNFQEKKTEDPAKYFEITIDGFTETYSNCNVVVDVYEMELPRFCVSDSSNGYKVLKHGNFGNRIIIKCISR